MNILALFLALGTISGIGLPCLAGSMDQMSRCSPDQMKISTCREVPLLDRFVRFVARGFRRLSEKSLLDHEKRRALYDLVLQTPGIDMKTLIAFSGYNENTLRYHMSLLEKAHKIRVTNEGGTLHFFENHGKFSEQEQKILSIQFTFGASRILNALSMRPGLSRGELADTLNIAGPSTTKSIQKLITEGMVYTRKDGKYTRYYLSDPFQQSPAVPMTA